MNANQIKGFKADVLGMIQARVEDIFIDFQNAMEIKDGDVSPVDALFLQDQEEALADAITVILVTQKGGCFADFRYPFVLDSVLTGKPAAAAGLMKGDSITKMNGKPIAYFDFREEMAKRMESQDTNHEVTLTYFRNGMEQTTTLTTDENYQMGVLVDYASRMPIVTRTYGFFESFPAGISLGVSTLTGYVSQMKYVFSKEGVKQLGGFGTIGSIFPATWDWHQFWTMTAFLAIILAFMNIIPIPGLDGGLALRDHHPTQAKR